MKETISNDNSTSLANSEELIASVAEKALGGADYLELDRRLDVSEIEYALATAPKDKSPGSADFRLNSGTSSGRK